MSKLLNMVIEINKKQYIKEKEKIEDKIDAINNAIVESAKNGNNKLVINFKKRSLGSEYGYGYSRAIKTDSYTYLVDNLVHIDKIINLIADHYENEGFHIDIGATDTYLIISWKSALDKEIAKLNTEEV